MRVAISCAALSLALAAIVAGQPQTSSPPQTQTPTFKSRIDLARLDVSVIENKTGKPVTDLSERDFSVTENGKPQTISTFSRELLTPEAPAATGAVVRGDGMAPRRRRVFVFILNISPFATGGPIKPLDGTIRFIRERLLPQDLVSVMAFNRATDLTTDHEDVAQVIERLRLRKDDIIYKMRMYGADKMFMSWDIPPEIQVEIDAIFQPAGLAKPGVRSVPSMLLNTDEFHRLDDETATSKDLAQPAYAGLRRPWNRWVSGSDLLKIYAAIEYLRGLEGDKRVVAMTHSLSMPAMMHIANLPPSLHLRGKDEEALLIARANDARVALDIVHTAGTAAPAKQGQSNLGGLDVLMAGENLAETTGGLFTSVRTADDAMDRIDHSTRTGYILGYTPTNPELDGKYRNVNLKVNRRDVTVVFRHGYTAQVDIPPLDLKDIVTGSRMRDVASTDLAANDIKLDVKADLVQKPGTPGELRVELKIDAGRLTLIQKGAKREGLITLWILCGDAKQEVVCSLKQDMTLSLDDVYYQRAMTGGIPYAATLPLTGPPVYVKVLVYDFGADLLGSVLVKLR